MNCTINSASNFSGLQAGISQISPAQLAASVRKPTPSRPFICPILFGFGSSVMGMNPWDRQAISLALPTVSLGGVPAIGGAEAAKASLDEAAHMQDVQSGAWVPADAMAFDKVIPPQDLRDEIIAVLQRDSGG